MKPTLLEWIDPFRQHRFFRFCFWAVRISMGLSFVLSGLRKLPGVKFTILPIDNPVGLFFHAMYETGFYWNSIGYIQILLGIMIFFNRTVVLAALLMMPVTFNIFMVSIALNMTGTPVITSAMLVGNVVLLLWHYENYLDLLKKPAHIHRKS